MPRRMPCSSMSPYLRLFEHSKLWPPPPPQRAGDVVTNFHHGLPKCDRPKVGRSRVRSADHSIVNGYATSKLAVTSR